VENRGYRHLELQEPERRHRVVGFVIGLVIVAFVMAVAFAAHAEGEAVTVNFACKSKAVAVNALKSANTADFLADATAKGVCQLFDSKPAVLGKVVGNQRATIGGRSHLMALSEIYFDRRGKPWYAWAPIAPVGEQDL